MINHARTLLRNLDGEEAAAVGFWPGDEYVDPCFRAVALPSPLLGVRRILFGDRPERVFVNYRTHQYLSLLHASDLAQFVTHFDSRITYDPSVSAFLDEELFQMIAERPDVYLLGELPAADDLSSATYRWRVTVVDGSTVSIQRQTPRPAKVTASYAYEFDLTNELPLPGSAARFMFQSTVAVGDSFLIAGYTRPQRSIGEIAADMDHFGRHYLNDLFGVGSPIGASEPFKTFRNLWYDHPQLPYKLGGLLAALIFQTERCRTNG